MGLLRLGRTLPLLGRPSPRRKTGGVASGNTHSLSCERDIRVEGDDVVATCYQLWLMTYHGAQAMPRDVVPHVGGLQKWAAKRSISHDLSERQDLNCSCVAITASRRRFGRPTSWRKRTMVWESWSIPFSLVTRRQSLTVNKAMPTEVVCN